MKKKILVVNNKMEMGGVSTAVISFLKNMKNDYDVDLILAEDGGEVKSLTPKDINVLYINFPLNTGAIHKRDCKKMGMKYFVTKYLTGVLVKIFSVSRFVGKNLANKTKFIEKKYDLIINNRMDFWRRRLGSCHLYAKYAIADKKAVVLHGDFEANNYDKSFFEEEYLTTYDYVIILSEAQKRRMIELFPKHAEKFVQIKNFEVPDDIIKKSKQIEVKYPKDIINFITVSRLAPEKAFERTLMALKDLKDEGFKFCWHILGDGDLKGKLEELIDGYKLNKNIKFYGNIENPYPYIKEADFLALLSYNESYGLVVEEALICHTPVCMTKTIAAEEIFTNNVEGIICENSQEGVYNCLKEMFNNYKNFKKNIKDYKFDNTEQKKKYNRLIGNK